MNMRKKLLKSASIALVLLSVSCEKPEGLGGNSTISGTVTVDVYDKGFRVLQGSYPAEDEEVFILYGKSETISDETHTSFNGKFHFNYLTEGDYTLFVYSEDSTGKSLLDVTVDTTVKVSGNKDVIENVNFTVYKTLDYDDGQASLGGCIYQVNWSQNFRFPIDTIYAQELDVYLIYENDSTYIERIRTIENGTYIFRGLLKGQYQVMVFSEDTLGSKEDDALTRTVNITEPNQHIGISDIFIANEM
jgi:hypothetical protein